LSLILTHIAEGIGSITLNYQIKRNALAAALTEEIAAALDEFARMNVRVAVLRAEPGAKVWSAGHDVDELPESGIDPLGWQDPLRTIIRAIEAFPAPVIALVEGSVWGGACELVFACDLIVSTPDASFAATPAKLGVPYNISGLLTFLNVAPAHVARELLFTAKPMSAAGLEQFGIINHVVDGQNIEAFTRDLARTIAQNSPLVVSVMKEQLRILAGAQALSPQDFERLQGLRRVVYRSRDYREGIRAFREKRKPVYLGE
jgi:methylmalonyl-CoA decarboxylase